MKLEDIGKISPRCYCDYTPGISSDEGGYFAHSILNSFPDVPLRVDFLNKFYQCLLYNQLPQKTRKLVVCGDNNSGKTSWARMFFGLMNESRIAAVTKEKVFALSMIDTDTELIFIDEWSEKTMSSENAKLLLQGGSLVKSVKYQDPRRFDNKAGIYLTCNNLPDFGIEQPNIDRRIAVFNTKELPEFKPEAPEWIQKNAMECLVWTIQEINRNIRHVPRAERFYEKTVDQGVPLLQRNLLSSEDLKKIESLSETGHIDFNLTLVPNQKTTIENTDEESRGSKRDLSNRFQEDEEQWAGPNGRNAHIFENLVEDGKFLISRNK